MYIHVVLDLLLVMVQQIGRIDRQVKPRMVTVVEQWMLVVVVRMKMRLENVVVDPRRR